MCRSFVFIIIRGEIAMDITHRDMRGIRVESEEIEKSGGMKNEELAIDSDVFKED